MVDFGSTYTKARLVDLAEGILLASAQAPSTVSTDVMDGLRSAVGAMPGGPSLESFEDCVRLACSSAAGGLRIVAIGLVRELTAEAATRAALGAGGRVVATFSGGLTSRDVENLEAIAPDLIVLAGGTDGGNRTCIERNAARLAEMSLSVPVVVAGNRNAAETVISTLRSTQKPVLESDNVLPNLRTIDTTACGEAIRTTFMKHIVKAKGLEAVESFFGHVVMPTPQAVLRACQLIADGSPTEVGMGNLMCVDIGGATTDVYSVADGHPQGTNVVQRGLPEPYAKRTVEGDLGLRLNAPAVVEIAGEVGIRQLMNVDAFEPLSQASLLAKTTEMLPRAEEMHLFDVALASVAARTAMRRHAGTLEESYTPVGRMYSQVGKDLRSTQLMIATGGIFRANRGDVAQRILSQGFFDPSDSTHLTPVAPRCVIDTTYVLYAVGLLSDIAPDAAMRIARASLLEARADHSPVPTS